MAEGNGNDEGPYSFSEFALKKDRNPSEDSDETDENFMKPDLGIGNEPSYENNGETFSSGEHNANQANDLPKREENPFSFKHFLKRDSGSSYRGTGARPKVYNNHHNDNYNHLDTPNSDPGLCTPRSSSTRHVGTPEFSSVLPDFVQDHLVVEQCYLGHSNLPNTSQLGVSLENLPDFALNSSSEQNGRSRAWDELSSSHSEVVGSDLTHNSTERSTKIRDSREALIPLDLPSDLGLPSFLQSPTHNGRLPFDLPLVRENVNVTNESSPPGLRGPQIGEVGISTSLPDFLSDGPIHSSRLSDTAQPSPESPGSIPNCSPQGPQPPDQQRPLAENERLKRELETTRRQLADKTRRVQTLERELLALRSKDHEEMTTLEKAIEQVEDNLKRSTRRAVTAESTVSKLKQELKSVNKEVSELRQENSTLRYSQDGASSSYTQPNTNQTQRVAQDLRLAALTAEQSLRSLMAGVGNLRIIASTLENMHRIHDQTGEYSDDFDDKTGPAL